MRSLLLALPWTLPVLAAAASAQVATPTWNADIGPLFAANCTACHSGPIGSAGLSLESYARAIAGSRNGPVLPCDHGGHRHDSVPERASAVGSGWGRSRVTRPEEAP